MYKSLSEKFSLNSNKQIEKVIFSDDNNFFLLIEGNNIRIFKFNGKRQLTILENQENIINVVFIEKKIYLAKENVIEIFNIETNTFEKKAVFEKIDHFLCFPNKKALLLIEGSGKIIFLDFNLNIIHSFSNHKSKVISLDFNSHCSYLITTSIDKTTKLWDIKFISDENKALSENNNTLHFIKSKKPEISKKIEFEPIGFLSCNVKERYEAPRQGVHSKHSEGIIKLNKYHNFEQAVRDLDGFDRIWILYHFHINDGWKPLVNPPRFQDRK